MSDPIRDERDDEGEDRDASKTSAIAAGVLGVGFTLVAVGTHGPGTAASVALGAAIAVANLLTMRAIVRALLVAPEEPAPPPAEDAEDADGGGKKAPERDHRGAGRRGGAAWGVFAVLKLFLLFGGILLLLTKGLVAPIPLVVGYGVLPLGIAASALWSSLRPRR